MKDIIDSIEDARAIVSLTYNKSHFIKFSEYISRKYSMECSILLGMMIDLENLYLDHYENFLRKTKGFFPMKAQYVDDRVGMSYHKQRQAFEKMKEHKLIFMKKWDGNVSLFKLNHITLSKVLIQGSIAELKQRNIDNKSHEDFNKKFMEMDKLNNFIIQKELEGH